MQIILDLQSIRDLLQGYCTFVGGNLVRSKKQLVVARSRVKVEYRAMVIRICELMWIKTLPKELQVDVEEPMRLYCNNKAAISISHNSIQRNQTKQVEMDRHFIKERFIAASYALLLFHLNYS